MIAAAIMLLALAIGASKATAASTRAEYVSQADPICQAGQVRQKAAFSEYRRSTKRYLKHHPNPDPDRPGKHVLRLAVHYYDRVLALQRGVNSQLGLVIPAPGDEAAVAEWLQLRGTSADLLERAIHALRRNKIKLFLRRYVKSINGALQSELSVRNFGFQYCVAGPPDAL